MVIVVNAAGAAFQGLYIDLFLYYSNNNIRVRVIINENKISFKIFIMYTYKVLLFFLSSGLHVQNPCSYYLNLRDDSSPDHGSL